MGIEAGRAAILPLPADPFLFSYWLRQYDNVWGREINTLYVVLNTFADKEVVDYIKKLCKARPSINFTYVNKQIPHGEAIDIGLEKVKEDYVMLIEDDGFIFKRGRVNFLFALLEQDKYDIIGGKRGSCSFEILERAKQIWGEDYEGIGDNGCNFWPNFFFTKTQILKDTDRHFDSKAWKQGELIPALGNWTAPDMVVGDTFVNTSLQLRGKGYRILTVPQHHCNTSDIEDYHAGRNVFDGTASWFHVGSLSSGAGGVLVDDLGRPLSNRANTQPSVPVVLPKYVNSEGERLEWERRVQWWLTGWENANPKGLEEFHKLYGEALTRVIRQYELRERQIRIRQAIYTNLLGGIYER